MKSTQLALAALLGLLLTGCATPKQTANLSGEWRWVCCEGKYWGEMKLSQFERTKLVGNFHDTSDSRGGTLAGTVTGNFVQLTRSFYNSQQQIKLALSPDGRKLNGVVSGQVDGTDWSAEFEAHRK